MQVVILKQPLYGNVEWNGVEFIYNSYTEEKYNDYYIYSIIENGENTVYTKYVNQNNTPPVANNVSLTANAYGVNIISINSLASDLTDPFKEFKIESVTGALYGTVSTDGYNIYYTSNAFNNVETLTYIITDKEYKVYKGIFHGTNYGMGVGKLALTARISESLAKELMDYYFHLNPEVKKWQQRIAKDVSTKGWIQNIFGRRAWFLNKNDVTLLNKAYAFIPQSSIADVINRATVDCYEKYSDRIDILMQVHDSLVFQYNIPDAIENRNLIKNSMEVKIPYSKQLIIPSDYKVSLVSYGDTQKVK